MQRVAREQLVPEKMVVLVVGKQAEIDLGDEKHPVTLAALAPNYLWCSENRDPFVGLGARDTQPGQAFHANYAASYEIFKDLRLGLNGYYLQQLTDDQIDGNDQARSKERIVGIGPGLKYTYERLSLYLNTYYATAAENRPEGVRGVFRISMVF